MRILVTGHDGYIGRVLVPLLLEGGHEPVGLDTYFYRDCLLGSDEGPQIPSIDKDVREVEAGDLEGFDAVLHLAALSNDPVGDLNAEITYDINFRASVRLAELAKEAGVPRWLFASSCSLYGASDVSEALDESAAFNPVTPYGESKVMTEQAVSKLAGDDFSPSFLRNATAYGFSPRHRGDIVVNNLVGLAYTTGEVRLSSDGTPWRPLVHIEDISRAFIAIAEAPREAVHNEAFNVGRNDANYQIRDVAEIVEQHVPDSRVTLAEGAEPDKRSYRVAFDKLPSKVPAYEPQWTVPLGVDQMLEAYRSGELAYDDLLGPRFQRLKRIKSLLDDGRLDDSLRWREPAAV